MPAIKSHSSALLAALAMQLPKAATRDIDDLMSGLQFSQQESLLREMLAVLATDVSDYSSVADWRVDVLEMLTDLRDSYEQLAGEQLAMWEREEKQHARSDYRELVTER